MPNLLRSLPERDRRRRSPSWCGVISTSSFQRRFGSQTATFTLAQDVAQTVFTDLARKADALSRRQVLNGWLYTSALFAATKAVRTERRRRAREQEAQVMHSLSIDSSREVDWSALRPVIDEAMLQLREADRDAVLLRYFEKRPLAEIGAKLGVTENTARMRVERALDKLRDQLVRRGVTTTTTALSTVVVANAIQAAPVGLAATLTSLSLAGGVGTAGSTLTLLKIMSMTKLQLGVSAVIIAGATTALVLQHGTQGSLRVENQSLQQQLNQLQSDNENLSKLLTRPKNVPALSLPAPRVTASASTIDTTTDWNSTNLIVRMQRGEKAPALTAQQAEAYLNENHRSAASLLAAFRATGDKTLLEEATQKFPGDPQVAFTAAYASDAPAEEQRRWLDPSRVRPRKTPWQISSPRRVISRPENPIRRSRN